ncbi:MAG: N-acetylneuraminate synthase family protein [Vicinamibacterales bacterium]
MAEIGINHNGSIETAKRLIDSAVRAGCDAVKFQKRTPELCVPDSQRDKLRETPWGYLTYLDYRYRVELDADAYGEINHYCREKNIAWFASCWDVPSVEFIEQFGPPCYKISSATLTDPDVLRVVRRTGRPIVLSTGMSTMAQIEAAVDLLGREGLILTHCTSTYPCQPSELNLRMIDTLRRRFDVPVGYSGHEVGLMTTVAAATMGACIIERHITLDRAMWGSDQAASVEPGGLERLVRYIRVVESAMGSGVKEVYASEQAVMDRLRRADATASRASSR